MYRVSNINTYYMYIYMYVYIYFILFSDISESNCSIGIVKEFRNITKQRITIVFLVIDI